MDVSHLYRSCTRKSVDEDRARIVAGFRDLLKGRSPVGVRLVNYYKGVPLSYPATVVEVSQGALEVDVHQQQAVALERFRYAFIKCDHFDCAILAEAHNVNMRTLAATLRNFSFVEIMAEKRRTLRLELQAETDAEIRADGVLTTGKLVDISLEGLSIRADRSCRLAAGEEVGLKVMVPDLLQNTLTPVANRARHVVTTREDGWPVCRFALESEPTSEATISRYIFQRQVEIIRELKELP